MRGAFTLGAGGLQFTLLDTTLPTLSLPADITLEADGPAGATATFEASSNDSVSGDLTVSFSVASGSTFPLGTTTVTATATDAAGNTASGTFKVTVRDTTAPTLSPPANLTLEAAGPNGAAATYAASASDAVSGGVPVSFGVASGSTFALGTTTVTVTATDAAGNTAPSTFTVTVVDTTAPVISAPGQPVVAADSAAGVVVNFAATAQDSVDGAVSVTYSHPPGSVFAPGQTLVTVTATDARGNRSTATFTVWVQFSWSGFADPINIAPSPTSVFKLGRTVPVKFMLSGGGAGITNATARLSFRKWDGAVEGDVNEADSTSAATAGDLFRYDASSGQYVFNWDTKPLASNPALGQGTYMLFVDLGDGVQRTVLLSLRN
jgi:hypothetical protein